MSALTDKIPGLKPDFSFKDVPNLQGRTAVVTGASQGIGLEVARALALSRARVLCLSLEPERGRESVEELRKDIKDRTGHEADVEWRGIDQRDLRNVRKVSDEIASSENRIDFILANAGIGVEPPTLNDDGFDTHLIVDSVSEMLFTNRLLPLLRKTQRDHQPETSCRVVTQSSELHRASKLRDVRFESVEEFKELLDANSAYARAKLANILFVKGLVKEGQLGQGEGAGVVRALASHPGVVSTAQQEGFKRAFPVIGTIMAPAVRAIAREPDAGALAMIWCAVSPDADIDGHQGVYADDPKHIREESTQAQDGELAANFWRNSEAIIRQVAGEDALRSWTEVA